jgi:proline iminopeptidase
MAACRAGAEDARMSTAALLRMFKRLRPSATWLLAAPLWLLTTGFSLPETVERDRSLPAVELNGYRFHAEAFGPEDRPVVIVLHGGPGADYRYLLALKALADERYRVVFYDQRGSGLSQRVPAQGITLDSFVDDLDHFVEHFGRGRPVHLVGHSWGAMLASAYAGRHPHKVAKMVLAEPAFLDASTADAMQSAGGPGLHVIWGFATAWLKKWFVRTGGDPYARDDFFLLQVLPLTQGRAQMCDGQAPPMQAWRFGSPSFDATIGRMRRDPAFFAALDFRRGVEAFEGQVLLLAGACNQVVGVAHQARHLRHFRHARLATVFDAGHFMFNDQPQRSVAIVRDFLDEPAARR